VVIGYGFMVRAELARAIVGKKELDQNLCWLVGWLVPLISLLTNYNYTNHKN